MWTDEDKSPGMSPNAQTLSNLMNESDICKGVRELRKATEDIFWEEWVKENRNQKSLNQRT